MKVVVYKAVFRPEGDDDYDQLYPAPCEPHPGVRYVIFRDVKAPYEDQGWEVLPQWFHEEDMRMRARHHKCCPHVIFPDADCTIWLDGSLTPKVHPMELATRYRHHLVNCFDRIKRRCLFDEGEAMAIKRRDDPAVIRAQMAHYRKQGMPRKHGLCATTAVLRNKGQQTSRFNEAWWAELRRWSNRDQVSVNYVLWKLGLPWGRLEGRWNKSPLFTWRPHYHTRDQ